MMVNSMNKKILLIWLLSGAALFANPTWKALNGPYGGQVYPLYINQYDQLYAQFSGKLWTSSDGKKWSAIPGLPNCLMFKAGGDGNLYVEDLTHTLYVSKDMGNSWTTLPQSPDLDLEHISISSTGDLYFARGAEVLVSRDAAKTWTPLAGKIENSAEYVAFDSAGNLYVFGKTKLFKSEDAGKSWRTLYASSVEIQDFLAISPNELLLSTGNESAGNILKSTDNGLSWKSANLPYARRLFQTRNWLMGASTKIGSIAPGVSFISSNNGASPTTVDVGFPIYAFAASTTGVVFAASADGLWSSSDGGTTFNTISPSAAEVVGTVSTTAGLFAVTRDSVTGKYRFWLSRDFGVSWNEVKPKALGEPSKFYDLQIFPDNRLWMLLGYPTGADRSVIYESQNGGASWTAKPKSPLEFAGFAFDESSKTCFSWDVGKKYYYHSSDYGNNWIPVTVSFSICSMLPAANSLVYALSGTSPDRPTGLYRSFNNGGIWDTKIDVTEPEGSVSSFCTNKFGDVFKAVALWNDAQKTYTLAHVSRSIDFGDAWQDITPKDQTSVPLLASPKIVTDQNGALFLQSSAYILSSLDNGDHWTVFFDRTQNGGADIRCLFMSGTQVYAGTFANSLWSTTRLPVLFQPQNIGGIEYPLVKTYGVNWIDYDSDGDDDLFLANEGANGLYTITGSVIKKVSVGDIAIDSLPSRAASWGDYNNDKDDDGYPDLYVCNDGVNNNLYRNIGDGTFKSITTGNIVESGPGSFQSCAWADVDRDGYLDLYVTNRDGANILYINDRDGHFAKRDAAIIGTPTDKSYGCGWCDFDNDIDMDLYVCNDGADQLWEQVSPMKFSLVSSERIAPNTGPSIGCSWGDVNNDGYMDLLVTNADIGVANKLYINNGNGSFRVASSPVTTDAAVSKGSGWADFDNDGDLDLLVSNNGSYFMYRNNGSGVMEKETATEFIYFGGNALSLAWGDFENDGDLDVVISSSDRKNVLYKNSGTLNNWLKIKCTGTVSNKSAIGANVRVKAVINGRPVWQTREISSQSGYIGQSSLVQHFGLGDATKVDSVVVIWPTGKRKVIINQISKQTISITEDTGSAVETPSETSAPDVYRLWPNYPNPFNLVTTIRYDLPRPGTVAIDIFDAAGRLVLPLLKETRPVGQHTIHWNGTDARGKLCPSGIYFVKMTAEAFSQVVKMTVLK